MLKSNVRSKTVLRNSPSKLNCLGSEIKSHVAWKGDVSLTKCAELLEGSTPFTYLLSEGFDKHHYFLSFVDVDHEVKHRNVRVFVKDGITMYINGGAGGGYESIDNLIPSCLNCSASVCRPL